MNDGYFSLRNVSAIDDQDAVLPPYMMPLLPDMNARILDFGCGFGQVLMALKARGFLNVSGADINQAAIHHLRERQVEVHDLNDETNFFERHFAHFDFVVMSHVLEHLPKDSMVATMDKIRQILRPNGRLLIMVPNAQANTDCYWAYEDFTHTTLFTAGSLLYVLRAAGFRHVSFVDVDCTAGLSPLKASLKKTLLRLYALNRRFWNKVTSSAYHAPSPVIFSYEIKALAKNDAAASLDKT